MIERKTRFRADVNKAYRLIHEKGLIGDGDLQYELNVSNGVYYRILRALEDKFPEINHENGVFFIKLEKETEAMKTLTIDYWSELMPENK